ncbi:hypothetical protein CC86DRAFT_105068 [Ophiobolus disseminans]|uniref:Protein kinase domain-containing protein n=1 Tax=Ophiobolus disseminans TaxID=1469910 RepID=A0A6A6ZKU0_9PLEO|nr:hypothetical protein CC86DRAFT_105068 [Ophiobolus disseminans]
MLTGRAIAPNRPTDLERNTPNSHLLTVVGWRPIVNTDIKLGNIVLGHTQPGHYPAYKTPKMTDFGLAFDNNKFWNRETKKSHNRPVWYYHIGTQGSRPPEIFIPIPHKTYGNAADDIRTDIWQMGKIMFALMEQDGIEADTSNYTFSHPNAYTMAWKRYYPELDRLIQRYVAVNPSGRPGIDYILWATRVGLQDWERANVAVDGANVHENLTWPWAEEEFPVVEETLRHRRWATKRRRDDDDDSDGESEADEDGENGEEHVEDDGSDGSSDGEVDDDGHDSGYADPMPPPRKKARRSDQST